MAHGSQTAIPCSLMRGGSSKGAYFMARNLPGDPDRRNSVVLAVMGGGDARQIDGLGGADPLTSKVAVIGPSSRPGADLDYLFLQVVVGEARVDDTPNCGNMLAGVVPFAIETGMITPSDGKTTARVHMVNSGGTAEIVVETPGGMVSYDGAAHIDGVPHTAAPIICNFLDIEGSACGALLPTGNVTDMLDGVRVTCIDNGMPVVVLRAEDLGKTGHESCEALEADQDLKARLESIRLRAGPIMNLGDVAEKVVPKMCLVAPPRAGGAISTRTFIPHVCHAAVGVLGAVTVASACVVPGAVTDGITEVPEGPEKTISIEHPSGEFTVTLSLDQTGPLPRITRAGLLRTARMIFSGEVFVPSSVWDGVSGRPDSKGALLRAIGR